MKRRLGSSEQLAVFFLRLDGKPIAAALAMIDRCSIAPNVSTFDKQWSKLSPGRVLLESLLEWAFQRKLTYELGAGEEPYKKSYVNREGRLITYTLPLSLLGAVYLAFKPWRDRLIVEAGRRIPLPARKALKRLLAR
jgi:CelD/BcsL family acetyltransferase involved in cellulose biosynthesis